MAGVLGSVSCSVSAGRGLFRLCSLGWFVTVWNWNGVLDSGGFGSRFLAGGRGSFDSMTAGVGMAGSVSSPLFSGNFSTYVYIENTCKLCAYKQLLVKQKGGNYSKQEVGKEVPFSVVHSLFSQSVACFIYSLIARTMRRELFG